MLVSHISPLLEVPSAFYYRPNCAVHLIHCDDRYFSTFLWHVPWILIINPTVLLKLSGYLPLCEALTRFRAQMFILSADKWHNFYITLISPYRHAECYLSAV